MPPRIPRLWPSWLPQSITVPSPSTQAARGLKSIAGNPKQSRFNKQPSLPILLKSRTAAHKRKEYTTPLRPGAIATKVGMSAVYDPATGIRTPCTILQLDRVQVISHKTKQRHGYFAVQIGSGWRHPSNITRPMLGHFARHQVSPKKEVVEFKVKDENGLAPLGSLIMASWFKEGQFVDTRSNCKGKGFAGGMKKHGWGGQPASHGQSLTHRTMGSAGGSQGSGSRVHPGKNMPGRMGGQQVTVQNLKVLKVDDTNGLLVLNGCVSGPKGCRVKVHDALKKPWPDVPVIPPVATPSANVFIQ